MAKSTRRRTPRVGRLRLERALDVLRSELRDSAEHRLDLLRELETARAYYGSLFEDSPLAGFTLNLSGVILEANRAAAELLGADRTVLIGKPLLVFVERSYSGRLLRHLSRCRAGESKVSTDLTLRQRSSRLIEVQLVSTIRPYDNERTLATIAIDLSKRIQYEEALQESESRYRQIVETANEGICIVDANNCVTFMNHRLARMMGGRPEDFAGLQATEFVTTARAAGEGARPGRRIATTPDEAEAQLRRLDGSWMWTSVSTSRLINGQGQFSGMLCMYTDITDRKELEATRRRLSRYMVAAQEAERRRVAIELHDQLGQHLLGFSLGLQRLSQTADGSPEAAPLIQRLQELAEIMARDVHHLAVELRPAALDDLGLAEAVSNYADDLEHRFDLEVDVHCKLTARLAATVETTIYRVIQEALTNVVKHARAKRASVIIELRGEMVQVVVEDDGIGFDADRLMRGGATVERLGLLGMVERATLVGGQLQVESSKNRGTSLFLRVPAVDSEVTSHEENAPVAG